MKVSKDLGKELDKDENLKSENKPKVNIDKGAATTSDSIRSIAQEAVSDVKDKGLVDIDEALDISSVIEELEAEETKRRLERIQRDAFKHDKNYLAARKREMKEKKALRKAQAEEEKIKAEEELKFRKELKLRLKKELRLLRKNVGKNALMNI